MRHGVARTRRGFSLIELVIVMLIMGIVAGLAVPKLNLSGYRVEAAARQVRSVLQTAQRSSLTRQYDMIVSFDTIGQRMRIVPDADNSGTVDAGELLLSYWRPMGVAEGNRFGVGPKGLTSTTPPSVNGPGVVRVNGLPSVIFHRNGSASSDAEIYVVNTARARPQYRVVTLVKATGRTDSYQFAGTGVAGRWELVP